MSEWKLRYPDPDFGADLPDVLAHVLETCHYDLDRPELDLRALFVPDDLTVNGRPAPGKTLFASPRENELEGISAWLYVSWEWWQAATGEQKEALVDHLLAHLSYDADREALRLVRPDLQEFSQVWKRRGDWNDHLEHATQVLQGRLPGLEEEVVSTVQDGVAEAVRNLAPKRDSGIASVTISSRDHAPVVLTADTREKINRTLGQPVGA